MSFVEFFRCPRTGSRLRRRDGYLESEVGGHRYPIVAGIVDFRLFEPPYMTRAEETELVLQLSDAAGRMSHEELVLFYESGMRRTPTGGKAGHSFLLGLRDRSPRRLMQMLEEADCTIPRGGRVLDLGCGSGEALARLLREGAGEVVGLDISLVELVLARKLLQEQGVEALLVAGCGESLPFAADTFDFVYSPDVIEHVTSQPRYLEEAHRVLRPDGTFLFNSPNRYSVVAPEPHVGIWFLTFLPRPMVDPVCRLLGRGPYTGKHLISLVELRRLTRKYFPRHRVFSRAANPAATSLVGRLFRLTAPWSERLYALVDHQHVVRAVKEARR